MEYSVGTLDANKIQVLEKFINVDYILNFFKFNDYFMFFFSIFFKQQKLLQKNKICVN